MFRSKNPILSFTSTSARLPQIDNIFRSHVSMAKELGMDVCFSCQDDAISSMTPYQKGLVSSGEVELLHIPKDHGSNTKWTLCRMAHPDAVMVVVDDDWEYDVEGIRSLIEAHKRHPKAVICRAYRAIPWVGKNIPLYSVKPRYVYPKTITSHIRMNFTKERADDREYVIDAGTAFPEHFLGALYPPNFPNCSPEDIPNECRRDDDVFVGARVAIEGRELVFSGNERVATDTDCNMSNALWEDSLRGNGLRTHLALKSVQDLFHSRVSEVGLGEVFVLTCKKYPRRRENIKSEMERLGIEYTEQYDDGTFLKEVGFRNDILNRCHLAKYLAIEKFLKTSADRITIVEDDVLFIKDVAEISDAVRSIPDDFGVCRFNWSESKYIRGEYEKESPDEMFRIEKGMSQKGALWAECPWASCDGCTVMSRPIAERMYNRLKAIIDGSNQGFIYNSDDILSRICSDLKAPIYAYKPLLCIQVRYNDFERGKCSVGKFLSPSSYHVPDVVRHLEDYAKPGEKVHNIADQCTYHRNIVNSGCGFTILQRADARKPASMYW